MLPNVAGLHRVVHLIFLALETSSKQVYNTLDLVDTKEHLRMWACCDTYLLPVRTLVGWP